MKFQTGQILNFKYYDGLFMKLETIGNLIHYGNRGYTHSAIIVDEHDSMVLVVEAVGKIVESWYPKQWLQNKLDNGQLAVGIPVNEIKNIKKRCEKHLGDKYDWMDIVDIIKFWFTGRRNVRNADNDTWICSEFVATMISPENDISDELGLPLALIAPMDLARSKLIKWNT